jgi:hypothetical protein
VIFSVALFLQGNMVLWFYLKDSIFGALALQAC